MTIPTTLARRARAAARDAGYLLVTVPPLLGLAALGVALPASQHGPTAPVMSQAWLMFTFVGDLYQFLAFDGTTTASGAAGMWPFWSWAGYEAGPYLVLAAVTLVGLVLAVALARWWTSAAYGVAVRHRGGEPVAGLRPVSGGPRGWIVTGLLSADTWRRTGWALLSAVVAAVAFAPVAYTVETVSAMLRGLLPGPAVHLLGALPGGGTAAVHPDVIRSLTAVSLLGGLLWLALAVPRLGRLHAAATLRVLRPDPEAVRLAARVDTLTRTRAGALDAHGAELRRIERDLHDGAQARLVDVTMRLGIAERAIGTDPDALPGLVRDARTSSEEAMTELRNVLRALYPPVLADRGLRGALAGLAARCTVPTAVEVEDGVDGAPAAVEAAVYFLVAESLTNVVKHSTATHADVHVQRAGRVLTVRVTDNGLGGVDESRGTGITGMHRRVEALDGWLVVTGPLGGPTTVVAELPCAAVPVEVTR